MDDKFNLGDLLKLELHNYVDACSEIVDRAQKELVIEKSLRKIEDTWGALNLTFSPYQVCTCIVCPAAASSRMCASLGNRHRHIGPPQQPCKQHHC